LESYFDDFSFNDGMTIYHCSFDNYSHNIFKEVIRSKGKKFEYNQGHTLINQTFSDDITHHNFSVNELEPISSKPTFAMQSDESVSTSLHGEINGFGKNIYFTNYDNLILDIDGKENAGQVLMASDKNGNAKWGQPAIEYTPSSAADENYLKGTICYDANFIYIKVNDTQNGTAHLWNRYAKSNW